MVHGDGDADGDQDGYDGDASTLSHSERGGRLTTFSFDSSGWMYVYHFGAAQYLQQHILPHLPPDGVAFSGSSGGALAGAALCCGVDVDALMRFIVACHPECEFNPWRLLTCAEEALSIFLPPGSEQLAQRKCATTTAQHTPRISCHHEQHATHRAPTKHTRPRKPTRPGTARPYTRVAEARAPSRPRRLRVLVTRAELKWLSWPLRPQVISSYGSHEELSQTLRATCHIPLLGGLRPYPVHRPDGSSRGAFFDGLFWPSILYAWRSFDSSDALFKTSGIGWPTAHIHLPIPVPPHWIILPPSQRTLWRLYAAGYDDAARFFAKRARHRRVLSSGHMLPRLDELPPPPHRPDYALLVLIVLGWLHLLLLTLCLPLVPAYLVVRSLLRPTSPLETDRRRARREAHQISACEEERTLEWMWRWFRQGAASSACLWIRESASCLVLGLGLGLGLVASRVRLCRPLCSLPPLPCSPHRPLACPRPYHLAPTISPILTLRPTSPSHAGLGVSLLLALWPLALLVIGIRSLWPFDSTSPLPPPPPSSITSRAASHLGSPLASPFTSRDATPPPSPTVRPFRCRHPVAFASTADSEATAQRTRPGGMGPGDVNGTSSTNGFGSEQQRKADALRSMR